MDTSGFRIREKRQGYLEKEFGESNEMYQETMTIDIARLRDDMRDGCLGAYFEGGFGAALMESFDIDRVSPEKLIEMAQGHGIDLRKYQV